jgi:hypothetical protein
MPKHYFIFIHGIGEAKENDSPSLSYGKLWKLLIKQSGLTPDVFNQQFGHIDVVWHVGQLHRAEEALFSAAFPGLKPGGLGLMPQLRDFMTFFIGDVAAYVSEDVNFIRRTVWQQIWSYQESGKPFKQLLDEGATYSIVSHSLGTVIAFDYLFHLFDPKEPQLFVPCPDIEKRPEDAALIKKNQQPSAVTKEELQVLQNSFRHFFSMGSPVALFLIRKGSLWVEGEPFKTVYNPVREKGRVWCNFWDSDDPIAYPVAELFKKNAANNECKLLDIPVETGWILKAHVDYWENQTVAKEIMNRLVEDDQLIE